MFRCGFNLVPLDPGLRRVHRQICGFNYVENAEHGLIEEEV
jgi:hypothetical protein